MTYNFSDVQFQENALRAMWFKFPTFDLEKSIKSMRKRVARHRGETSKYRPK